jgi:hypothetical protein
LKANRTSGAGQAMIEFVVAIFAVVFLIAGIIQFAELAGAKGRLLLQLRGDAGPKALSTIPFLPDSPDYLRTWEEGDDAMRHTADDDRVRGQAGNVLQQQVVDRSVPAGASWLPLQEAVNRDIATLHETALPMTALGFLHTQEREVVELLPAMRTWIYGRDNVTVGAEIWLPRLHLDGFDP